MCLWKVAEADRHCEFCVYEGCGQRMPCKESVRAYLKAMEAVVGDDFYCESRKRRLVWARNIVAYQMFKDGYKHSQIGKAIHRDRTSAMHAINNVTDMLSMPRQYPQEMAIWREFQKKLLSLQQNL